MASSKLKCLQATKIKGVSGNVPFSNIHGTYILWLQSKRAQKVRKWYAMSKQTWHLHAMLTKQKSMESQKVMCHVQTDMALTPCDYKAREPGKSGSDVPCSNKHGTYPRWLQSKRAWKVRKWCAMFKQTWHLHAVITKIGRASCRERV